ncbi:hypothetical protein [Kiloniella sp. EL199]|uniref:hypothetical protein n=1 Tax=Kiloniella sp. EL199 TaxID=2107581 RepID=UPI000EA257AE|nr:hypothetical protein [Kiloniella sp. EL199]
MHALTDNFETNVKGQIHLLNQGHVLEALDLYFHDTGIMFENDNLFAHNKAESRKKQEPYINSAKKISGKIEGLTIVPEQQICLFFNKSLFTNQKDQEFHINGLHWQQWYGSRIQEERYYSGSRMQELIKKGLTEAPEKLKFWLEREYTPKQNRNR